MIYCQGVRGTEIDLLTPRRYNGLMLEYSETVDQGLEKGGRDNCSVF